MGEEKGMKDEGKKVWKCEVKNGKHEGTKGWEMGEEKMVGNVRVKMAGNMRGGKSRKHEGT